MISILVPVFNEARYISQALESILVVKDCELEVIVVDDGSDDETFKIASSVDDPRVRCYKNIKKGKVSAYNLAYSKAKGDYFVLFAGDDKIVGDVLRKRVEVFHDCGGKPAISLCKVQMFSNNKKFDGIVFPKRKALGASTGGGMAFNRALADLIFPIPESLPNEDSWIKMFLDFYAVRIFHVPEIGLRYRIHENNSLRRDLAFSDFSERLRQREKASNLFLDRFGLIISDSNRSRLIQRCAAQSDRYNGRFVRIFLRFGLPLREKISLVFYSHRFLFFIRNVFYSFFSGR